jgi:hypothetical protein
LDRHHWSYTICLSRWPNRLNQQLSERGYSSREKFKESGTEHSRLVWHRNEDSAEASGISMMDESNSKLKALKTKF